jgi:DNA-binding GntR family transcriptional regulator
MKAIPLPENLTTLAYKNIKDFILREDLDEKTRLTEESIAKQLGISKSPVREAFNRLESEGLICIEPRRGARLRTFSIKDIGDLYDVREALEVHAVARAAITPAVLDELHDSLERQKKCMEEFDKAGYIHEDVHFHLILAKATGNDQLYAMLENLQNQILLIRRKTYDLTRSQATAIHASILHALEIDLHHHGVDHQPD